MWECFPFLSWFCLVTPMRAEAVLLTSCASSGILSDRTCLGTGILRSFLTEHIQKLECVQQFFFLVWEHYFLCLKCQFNICCESFLKKRFVSLEKHSISEEDTFHLVLHSSETTRTARWGSGDSQVLGTPSGCAMWVTGNQVFALSTVASQAYWEEADLGKVEQSAL